MRVGNVLITINHTYFYTSISINCMYVHERKSKFPKMTSISSHFSIKSTQPIPIVYLINPLHYWKTLRIYWTHWSVNSWLKFLRSSTTLANTPSHNSIPIWNWQNKMEQTSLYDLYWQCPQTSHIHSHNNAFGLTYLYFTTWRWWQCLVIRRRFQSNLNLSNSKARTQNKKIIIQIIIQYKQEQNSTICHFYSEYFCFDPVWANFSH